MLEQDLASIMRFLTEKSGSPAPYYNNVPEQFRIPAVYFPRPEIGSSAEHLRAGFFPFRQILSPHERGRIRAWLHRPECPAGTPKQNPADRRIRQADREVYPHPRPYPAGRGRKRGTTANRLDSQKAVCRRTRKNDADL